MAQAVCSGKKRLTLSSCSCNLAHKAETSLSPATSNSCSAQTMQQALKAGSAAQALLQWFVGSGCVREALEGEKKKRPVPTGEGEGRETPGVKHKDSPSY